MLAEASLGDQLWVIITNVAKGFANVPFTGSLILMLLMMGAVLAYAKRRPVGSPLTWGQAMVAAMAVTFALFWAFGVVPHQWLTYAEGSLRMRSDAILAGPGSTGLAEWSPVVISKAVLSDSIAVGIYGLAMTLTFMTWSRWQKRGQGQSDEVETSTYGRPLVKT